MLSKVSGFSLIPVIIFTLIVVFSCRKKDKLDSSPSLKLTFSTDTVFFDTVFTTLGSVTHRLLVHNDNNNKVNVSSIRLAGGIGSVFSLNIDGAPGPSANDVEIAGHDSIYIFVKVTLNPNNQSNPLIITDSILFNTNGNLQKVQLVAWGQDAYFYKNKILTGNITWDSLKPRVIFGYLRIDTNATLNIQAGTKLYFHQTAYLSVSYHSTITIAGSIDHPVRFQGDRLDPFYRDLPGQWDGIYLEPGSQNNDVNYAIIKNGNFGLSVDSSTNNGTVCLKIRNTIIQNMTSNDIYAYRTSIYSENCVLEDCGSSSLFIELGGSYEFRQMTIANYWSNSVRFDSAFYISNFAYDTSGRKIYNPLTQANFFNTIVYGNQDDELSLDGDAAHTFTFKFDHCLLKTHKNTSDANLFNLCIVNKDPGFVDISKYDYELDSINSPAYGAGNALLSVPQDIKGVSRAARTDIGAYEYVPK
jgi:hypothetical protein